MAADTRIELNFFIHIFKYSTTRMCDSGSKNVEAVQAVQGVISSLNTNIARVKLQEARTNLAIAHSTKKKEKIEQAQNALMTAQEKFYDADTRRRVVMKT